MNNSASRRFFAIVISTILAAFVFLTASGADRKALETPFPGDYPQAKQTILVAEQQTQEAGLLTPTPPAGVAKAIEYPTAMPADWYSPGGVKAGAGILVQGAWEPLSAQLGVFVPNDTAWILQSPRGRTVVFAGSLASDPDQGALNVVEEGSAAYPYGTIEQGLRRTGSLRIVDAVDQRLVLRSSDGSLSYYDLPADRFSDSPVGVLPTRTAAPTLTPRPAPQGLTADDAPDELGLVTGPSPLNKDLRLFIGTQKDVDWFFFVVPRTEPAKFSLVDLPASFGMEIFDMSSLGTIGAALDPGTEDKTVTFTPMPGGLYAVKVSGINGAHDVRSPYVLRVSEYLLMWNPPFRSQSEPYAAKAGSNIPVKFSVNSIGGDALIEEDVELTLTDANGIVAMGPFFASNDPNTGIKINNDGTYHFNLRTKGLALGSYSVSVYFPQYFGENVFRILLK